MKKTLITFFTILFCLTSSVVWSVESIDLVEREGLLYKKFTDVPFTGEVTGIQQGLVKNGDLEGLWIGYHDNGKLSWKGDYKNGKKHGSWIDYYKSGQLRKKGNYKNDEREGSWVWYSQDGTIYKVMTGTYKNGKKISD